MDTDQTPAVRQPGRWKQAWRALRGLAPAPAHVCVREVEGLRQAFDELRADHREFILELSGYMEKMNTWAARQAKRDKRRALAALDADESPATRPAPSPATPADRKRELRAQLARARGFPARFGSLNGDDEP